MRTLCVGDIHGAHKALVQVLEVAAFDYENDRLICLGDVCDGWPETKRVIEELLLCHNLVYILGNHDEWMLDWLRNRISRPDPLWVNQGGQATLNSYTTRDREYYIPHSHYEFLRSGLDYFSEGGRVFVHGGMMHNSVLGSSGNALRWGRDFWYGAIRQSKIDPTVKLGGHDMVYLGHTSVGPGDPVVACNVINLDTGAGWNGVLTIMDVDSGEWWQSDNVLKLYPGVRGRG